MKKRIPELYQRFIRIRDAGGLSNPEIASRLAPLERGLLEKLFQMGNNDHHTLHGITGDAQRKPRKSHLSSHHSSGENRDSSNVKRSLSALIEREGNESARGGILKDGNLLGRILENLKENLNPQIFEEIRGSLNCQNFEFLNETLDFKNVNNLKKLESIFDVNKLQELVQRHPELLSMSSKTTSERLSRKHDKHRNHSSQNNRNIHGLATPPYQFSSNSRRSTRGAPTNTPPPVKNENELSYFMSPAAILKDHCGQLYYDSPPPMKKMKTVEGYDETPNVMREQKNHANLPNNASGNNSSGMYTNSKPGVTHCGRGSEEIYGGKPQKMSPSMLMSATSHHGHHNDSAAHHHLQHNPPFYTNSFLFSPMGMGNKYESPSRYQTFPLNLN